MITLDKDSLKARFFLLCLRTFRPFTCGLTDGGQKQREPEWYINNGTTLCHFFWTCLWFPLIALGFLSFIMLLMVTMHVTAYQKYGTPGLFLPFGFVIGVLLAVAIILLAIIGAGKAGLLAYLKSLKEKVCPLITFTKERDQ